MEKKTALITGAGSGLGSGIVRVLARNGYDVAIHTGTNAERARALAESLAAEYGVRAEVFLADFPRQAAHKDSLRSSVSALIDWTCSSTTPASPRVAPSCR